MTPLFSTSLFSTLLGLVLSVLPGPTPALLTAAADLVATGSSHTQTPPSTRPEQRPPRRPARPVVYLTFDDGPSAWTPQVLRILAAHRATATFFQLGVNVPAYPKAQRAIRRQGSTIGNHTHDHSQLTRLSGDAIRSEIDRGPSSRCLRPPYGAHDARVDRIAASRNLRMVLWTADTRDWARPGVPAILRGALLGLHPGSIILMHDGGGDRSQTVEALPRLLRTLHRKGYRVRALPSC